MIFDIVKAGVCSTLSMYTESHTKIKILFCLAVIMSNLSYKLGKIHYTLMCLAYCEINNEVIIITHLRKSNKALACAGTPP